LSLFLRDKPGWLTRLSEASDAGNANPVTTAVYSSTHPAAVDVECLLRLRSKASRIGHSQLGQVVEVQVEVLKEIDRGGSDPKNLLLGQHYEELISLIGYAERSWAARRIRLLDQLETRFGLGTPLPTRMGNIAAALDSYSLTRYRMNLGTFWNRMQPVMQSDERFYRLLVDAKSQLDFLVTCCWLSMATAMGWMLAMPLVHFSWAFYVLITLLVPALARFFYLVAVENYLIFADVVKSAVDLFRFNLLESLHIRQPTGIREERALWTSLQDLSTFGKEGLALSYQHEEK
jgi:hypothetical protein